MTQGTECVFTRGCGDPAEVAGLDANRLFQVMSVEFFLHVGFETRSIGAFDPERVAWHEGLADDNQLATFGGTFGNPVDDFCQRRIALEPDRCDLAQRDGKRIS